MLLNTSHLVLNERGGFPEHVNKSCKRKRTCPSNGVGWAACAVQLSCWVLEPIESCALGFNL